jgi:hypothetical protein
MRRFCFSTLTNSNPAEVAGGWFPPATMRPHQSFSGVLLTESFRHLDREVALEILRTAAGNSPETNISSNTSAFRERFHRRRRPRNSAYRRRTSGRGSTTSERAST